MVKRSNLAVAFSLLLMAATLAPAMAKDENSALDKSVQGGLMVTRVGGVGAGVVVGAPVAVVRETISSYKSMTETLADKVGGKDNGLSCALVSLVTVPGAMVVGSVKGMYYGSRNGIMHGFQEPFSPASFSISKDIEKE